MPIGAPPRLYPEGRLTQTRQSRTGTLRNGLPRMLVGQRPARQDSPEHQLRVALLWEERLARAAASSSSPGQRAPDLRRMNMRVDPRRWRATASSTGWSLADPCRWWSDAHD